MTTFYLYLRILNLILYVALIVALVMRSGNFTRHGLRGFGVGLYVFMAASAWATIEIMSLGVPGGPRVIILTVPLIAMVVNLYGDSYRLWRRSPADPTDHSG